MRLSFVIVVAATTVAVSAKNRLDDYIAVGGPKVYDNTDVDADITDLDHAFRSLGTDDAFEESGEAQELLARAADDCAGINLRAWPGRDANSNSNAINSAIVAPRDCTTAARFNGMTGLSAAWVYTPRPQPVTATTDPRTAQVRIVSGTQKQTGPFRPATCDHILELNVLKGALNDGACEMAEAMTAPAVYIHYDYAGAEVSRVNCTEGQKRIMEIRNIVTRAKNLVQVQSRIEELKSEIVNRMKTLLGAGNVGRTRPMDFLAMTDYVLVKTVAWSRETAALLDAAIEQRFPAAPKGRVTHRWGMTLTFIQLAARERRRQIEDEKRAAGCAAAPPATVKRSSANFGRFSSDFDNLTPDNMPTFRRSLPGAGDPVGLGWSPLRGSSLERRARKTPRSGPKAPAGASCPLKKSLPKKVVPKSQAKMRPKPATKPRQPASRPAPRQPANKQVAKRPANRPRRQPGKQTPHKRTMPKRRPKAVPKPTRRPKGKPRARKTRRR